MNPTGPKPTRQVLEDALAADPDDRATHAAFADLLMEQGDPRGEFIQVQRALEDPALPSAERWRLQLRELELWEAHGRTWIGGLERILSATRTQKPQSTQFAFRRGWLDRLVIDEPLNVAMARLLAAEPTTRLLSRLAILEAAYEGPDRYEPGPDVPTNAHDPGLYPLLRSAYLGNVRSFTYGPVDEAIITPRAEAGPVVALVGRFPRLEELRLFAGEVGTDELFGLETFDNLRVLQVYHADNFALEVLAANPHLAKLETLLLQPRTLTIGYNDGEEPPVTMDALRALVRSPHLPSLKHLRLSLTNFGDEGMIEIIDSGILRRLKVLELPHGNVTDVGAALLADCPDRLHLERLDLTDNGLTATGRRLLLGAVPNAVVDDQHDPNDLSYLYQGDWE